MAQIPCAVIKLPIEVSSNGIINGVYDFRKKITSIKDDGGSKKKGKKQKVIEGEREREMAKCGTLGACSRMPTLLQKLSVDIKVVYAPGTTFDGSVECLHLAGVGGGSGLTDLLRSK